jgi:aryl-alcohol dehydrogenase-like predicted oxidoreductase
MSDINVSRLVYGTYRLPPDYSEFKRMLHLCFSSGIMWIDTSQIYNRGISESWISNWEQDSHHQFKIASKAGKFYGTDGKLQVSNALENLTRSIEGSLRRLKRDKLELLFVHDFEESKSKEEIKESLLCLSRRGLVQRVGLSNFPIDITTYLINEGCVNCMQISCLDLNIEEKISLATNNGIEYWLYRPFNKGINIRDYGRSPADIIKGLMQKYPDCKILFGATKLNQLEWIKTIK